MMMSGRMQRHDVDPGGVRATVEHPHSYPITHRAQVPTGYARSRRAGHYPDTKIPEVDFLALFFWVILSFFQTRTCTRG